MPASGVAYELGAEVAGFLLDTSHEQRLSTRSLDAATTGGHDCPKRLVHDTPLLSGESIDLHQHLLDRINRIEGAELAGAERVVNRSERTPNGIASRSGFDTYASIDSAEVCARCLCKTVRATISTREGESRFAFAARHWST